MGQGSIPSIVQGLFGGGEAAPTGKLFTDALPMRPGMPTRNPLFSGPIDKPSAGPVESVQGKLMTPGSVPPPANDPVDGVLAARKGPEPDIMARKPAAMPPRAASSDPVIDAAAPTAPGPQPAPSAGLFSKMPDSIGGVMSDIQAKLKGAPTNPLFQTGMGLAAAGFDGGNPYANIVKNLGGIQAAELAARAMGLKESAEERAKSSDEREAQAARDQQQLALMLAQIGSQYSNPQTEGTAKIARGAKVIR